MATAPEDAKLNVNNNSLSKECRHHATLIAAALRFLRLVCNEDFNAMSKLFRNVTLSGLFGV